MKKSSFFIGFIFLVISAAGQYAPAVGQPGSTAISKDSNVIVSWANQVSAMPSWQNIANQSLGKTTTGNNLSGIGKADNDVISLGDGGTAILQFAQAITNGPGPDFAVFENSFDDFFLELAFVEVSSDGTNYYRFPAFSLTQTDSQVTTFGHLDCEKIHNLAGKYRGGYGTPFDLEEIKNTTGLDITHITHIKIIDVIGSLDSLYSNEDTEGRRINDPFPTPFPIGGFDLDAVAALNLYVGIDDASQNEMKLRLYPNPVSDQLTFEYEHDANLELVTMQGQVLYEGRVDGGRSTIDVGFLPKGIYLLRVYNQNTSIVTPFVKN